MSKPNYTYAYRALEGALPTSCMDQFKEISNLCSFYGEGEEQVFACGN